MKVKKFLLIILFIFTINIQNLLAEDDKIIKGLEIFNEVAGAEANIGPNLDTVNLTEELVKEMVTYGLGVMPAYGEGGMLTKEEIDIVSYFVANSSGK